MARFCLQQDTAASLLSCTESRTWLLLEELAQLFGQAMSALSQLAPPLQAVVCLLSQPPDEVLPYPQAGMPFLADA